MEPEPSLAARVTVVEQTVKKHAALHVDHEERFRQQAERDEERDKRIASIESNHGLLSDAFQALAFLDEAIAKKLGIEPEVMDKFRGMLQRRGLGMGVLRSE